METTPSVVQKLYGEQLPMRARVTNIFFSLGLLVFLVSLAADLLSGLPTQALLTEGLGFLPVALFWAVSARKPEHSRTVLTLALMAVNFLYLPIVYLTGGSINSGVSAYFLLVLALLYFYVRTPHRKVLMAAAGLYDLALYGVAYLLQDRISGIFPLAASDRGHTYFAIGLRVVIVSAVLSVFGKLLFRMLRHENHRVTNAIEEISRRAEVDPLTGLYNRRYLYEHLDALLQQARETGRPLSVILVDIDFFKDVNDRYGHIAGDEILSRLSRLLMRYISGPEVVARYGGEEFVFVLPGCSEEAALERAERLREAVEAAKLSEVYGDTAPMTVSAGVSVLSPGMDAVRLIETADRAMYRAKGLGRNRVCLGEERDRP